jgi:Tfp pilus assembly protein FimT
MQRCQGYQVGRSVLVSRESLIAYLDHLHQTGAVEREITRKQNLLSTLAIARTEARGRAIQIPMTAPSSWRHFDDLPPGIRLLPGQLTIRFSDSTELLQSLFALAQAITNDPQRFHFLADQPPAPAP